MTQIHIMCTILYYSRLTNFVYKGSNVYICFIQANKKPKRSRSLRKQKEVSLSKTKEWGQAIDSEHLSEITEEELEVCLM